MNDKSKVSTGKPKVTGAVHWAPKGTPVPTSVYDELDSAFLDLGYLSEDGVELGFDNTSIKAWGGEDVIVFKDESIKINFLQSTDENVLKVVFGTENVTVDDETGEIHVKSMAEYSQEGAFVFDMIMRGNVPRRLVAANGTISEVGSVTYKDKEAIIYPVTITCNPDETGAPHHEYIGGSTEISG